MKMINGHIACVLINTNPSLDNEKKKKGKEKKTKPNKKTPQAFTDTICMLLSKASLAGGCVPSKLRCRLLSIRKQQPEKMKLNQVQSIKLHLLLLRFLYQNIQLLQQQSHPNYNIWSKWCE